jgi:hypothetical protein
VSIERHSASAALQRLEPFIGEWSLEAAFPSTGPAGVGGRAVFEWALGAQFLIERSEVADQNAPDGLVIIAFDADRETYLQHYFDSRGVVRLYAMTFDDGVWTLVRDSPDFSPLSFWQRFTGTFSDDGRTIRGSWETSPDGSAWEHDFDLTYGKIT